MLNYVIRNKKLVFSLVIIVLLMMLSIQYLFVLSSPENNLLVDNFLREYRPHFLFVLGGVRYDAVDLEMFSLYQKLNDMVIETALADYNSFYNKNVSTALNIMELHSTEEEYLSVIISKYDPVIFGFQPVDQDPPPILIYGDSMLSSNISRYLKSRLNWDIGKLLRISIENPFILGDIYDYDYIWVVSDNSTEVAYYISLIIDFVNNSSNVSMFNRSALYIAVNYNELPNDVDNLQVMYNKVYSDIVDSYLSLASSLDAKPTNGSIIKVFVEQPDETPYVKPPKYNLIITHEGLLRNLIQLSRSGGEILFYLSNVYIAVMFPIFSLFIGIINRFRRDLTQVNRVILFRGIQRNALYSIVGFSLISTYIVSSLIYIGLSSTFNNLLVPNPLILLITFVIMIFISLFVINIKGGEISISRKIFLLSLMIYFSIVIPGITRVSFTEIFFKYVFVMPIYLFSTPFYPLSLLIIYLFILSNSQKVVKYVWRGDFNSYPARLWMSNRYLNYVRISIFSFLLSFIVIDDSFLKVYQDVIGTSGIVYSIGFPRVLSLYTIHQFIVFSKDMVMIILPLLYVFYLINLHRALRYDEAKMRFRAINPAFINKFKTKVFFSHLFSDVILSILGATVFILFLEGYVGFYYGYFSPIEDMVYDPPSLLEVFLG